MKILILQNKGKSYGGVWQVNKTIGEALIKKGYDITILSIRENKNDYEPEYDKRMHVETLNKVDLWETYSFSEIIKEFKRLKIAKGFKYLIHRFNNNILIKKDIKKLHEYIFNLKPDYILVTQYQILDMIPKEYLKNTFFEQHSSFKETWPHKATRKTLIKYKDKVKFIWLCKTTMEEAIKQGLTNSTYIYNAVRFETNKLSDVAKNKKLVAIARINVQKRIDLMVKIIEELFQDKKYSDWTFEIWGDGEDYSRIKSLIKSKQIKLMGRTNNPMEVLLSSSISLNASEYEGFALTILESNECGVPTVAFDFGESTKEEIIDGKTGFIAKDNKDYLNKLKLLMDDTKLLQEIGKNAKKYNDNFRIENIVKDWERLFNNEKK